MKTFAYLPKGESPTVDRLKAALRADLSFTNTGFINSLTITKFTVNTELCDDLQDHYDLEISGAETDIENLKGLLNLNYGESYENMAD